MKKLYEYQIKSESFKCMFIAGIKIGYTFKI